MKHAIIGGGNLGLDICEHAGDLPGTEVKLFTAHNGCHYSADRNNKLIEALQLYKPDHIWVTVGAGSVEGAKKDLVPYIDLHIRLPAELLQKMPEETTLHFFSSNYVFESHQSLYAKTKATMEDLIISIRRPNTYVYRVESLYGTHRPEKTFPGKFLARNPKPGKIELPKNLVTPTPTAWIAKMLVNSGRLQYSFHNIAPTGAVSVAEWARLVVDNPKYEIIASFRDFERPSDSKINCTLPEHNVSSLADVSWLELWNQYYKKEDYL